MTYKKTKDKFRVKSVQPQNTITRRVPAFWIYGLLIILAVYAAVTYLAQEEEIRKLQRNITEVEANIKEETETIEALEEQKRGIESGDSIEQLAREKLGYVKEGERIFVDTNR